MDVFSHIVGLIFLGLCALWTYGLIKNRKDLFQSSVLLKASQTLAIIALLLCGLVALLLQMLGGDSQTGEMGLSETHSTYREHRAPDPLLEKAI